MGRPAIQNSEVYKGEHHACYPTQISAKFRRRRAALGVNLFDNPLMQKAFACAVQETPIIWLAGGACSGCSVSLLNTLSPRIQDVLLDQVIPGHHTEIAFHPTVIAASGDLAMQAMYDTEEKPFILVVEGSITTAECGRHCEVGEKNGKGIPILEHVLHLGNKAKGVLAVGSCASVGEILAAHMNPSGAKGVREVFKEHGDHPDHQSPRLCRPPRLVYRHRCGDPPRRPGRDQSRRPRPPRDVLQKADPRLLPVTRRLRRRALRPDLRRGRLPLQARLQGTGVPRQLPGEALQLWNQLVNRQRPSLQRLRRTRVPRRAVDVDPRTDQGQDAALGLGDFDYKPVSGLTESIQHRIFQYFIPPIAVYSILGGIMAYNQRRKHNAGIEGGDDEY